MSVCVVFYMSQKQEMAEWSTDVINIPGFKKINGDIREQTINDLVIEFKTRTTCLNHFSVAELV